VEVGALEQAERRANEIIWEDRPVTPHQVTMEEARALPLRKMPDLGLGPIRLVEIAGFDLTACGGTHVAATGGVGLLKILKASRRGDELRIEFVCGRRALDDYAYRHHALTALAASFTTDFHKLPAAVAGLREELKQESRRSQQMARVVARYEAAEMLRAGQAVDGARVVCRSFTDRGPAELRLLATEIARAPDGVAMLGLPGPKSQLVFARAESAPGDAAEWLRAALPYLGDATGGGTAVLAQGGGPSAGPEAVKAALNAALARLRENHR
jgi:alanyl-tRNA synthetase